MIMLCSLELFNFSLWFDEHLHSRCMLNPLRRKLHSLNKSLTWIFPLVHWIDFGGKQSNITDITQHVRPYLFNRHTDQRCWCEHPSRRNVDKLAKAKYIIKKRRWTASFIKCSAQTQLHEFHIYFRLWVTCSRVSFRGIFVFCSGSACRQREMQEWDFWRNGAPSKSVIDNPHH